MDRVLCRWLVIALVLLSWLPAAAAAQGTSTGTIVGTVTDESGAVLPGVTVEASSPALIEKVRSAVTDERGLFQIASLQPGAYKVTFTLPGFAVFIREGLTLTAGFIATVDGQLKIGELSETITVSGEAPLVDVRSVATPTTITADLIESLPTGKTLFNLAVLVPGVSMGLSYSTGGVGQDVGGTIGEANGRMIVHGSYVQDMPTLFDGLTYQMTNGLSARNNYMFNAGAIQEVSTVTGVLTVEQVSSGVYTNQIPKTGGNRFSGYFFGNYVTDAMQANNISQEILDRGFRQQGAIKRIWDFNPAIGGPIKRDRLWFFYSYRYWGHDDLFPGFVHEKNPGSPRFERGEPALSPNWYKDNTVHLTAQMTRNQKFGFHWQVQNRCSCSGLSPSSIQAFNATTQFRVGGWHISDRSRQLEAAIKGSRGEEGGRLPRFMMTQGTWNWTASDKILVEAGYAYVMSATWSLPQAGVPLDAYPITELSSGTLYNAPQGWGIYVGNQGNSKTSISYVTGRHNLKVGVQTFIGHRYGEQTTTTPRARIELLNGQAAAIVQSARPQFVNHEVPMMLGIYAQEQWTVKNFTFNLGGRFDYLNAYVPGKTKPATRFVPAHTNPQLDCTPCWWDFNPRGGVNWDVFGNGRTAIKFGLGRYVEGIQTRVAEQTDPENNIVQTTRRTWTDNTGTFNPELACDLKNPDAQTGPNGSCGPIQDRAFGTARVVTTHHPDYLTGSGKRWANWEISPSVQHELRPGLSVFGGYTYRWYDNFNVLNNLAVSPSDFDEFCVQAPNDPRLGSGSGQQHCGFYNVKREKLGVFQNIVGLPEQVGATGKMAQYYHGFDIGGTLRAGAGMLVQGGLTVGSLRYDYCLETNTPGIMVTTYENPLTLPTTKYCEFKPPMQPQVRLLGTYPLPWWDLMVSATYQHQPGQDIRANAPFTSAAIRPSLGRDLSQGANAVVSLPLIAPGTMFGESINQIDFRTSKAFRIKGRIRVEGILDLYNALNANPVLAWNQTYGPAWLTPISILPGRLVKASVQMNF